VKLHITLTVITIGYKEKKMIVDFNDHLSITTFTDITNNELPV